MIFGTWLDAAVGWVKASAAAILTGALVAVVCLPLGYCKGQLAAERHAAAERALANAEAMMTDSTARDRAASERAADMIETRVREGALIEAIKEVPDEKPDAVRVALGCQRLRAQGAAGADLPPVCRYPGGD